MGNAIVICLSSVSLGQEREVLSTMAIQYDSRATSFQSQREGVGGKGVVQGKPFFLQGRITAEWVLLHVVGGLSVGFAAAVAVLLSDSVVEDVYERDSETLIRLHLSQLPNQDHIKRCHCYESKCIGDKQTRDI